MIKNKLTPEIKSKFLEAINRTKTTGKEHGFYLCIDQKQNLFPSKLISGDERKIKMGEPSIKCHNNTVQGDFHTHNYFTLTKQTSKLVKGMSDKEIKNFMIDKFQEYKDELGIKELTINSPSSKDLLKSITHVCSNIDKGTTCVGTDMGNDKTDKVECWTVKEEDLSMKDCVRALHAIYENGKEKDKVGYVKWAIPLFNREVISVKR